MAADDRWPPTIAPDRPPSARSAGSSPTPCALPASATPSRCPASRSWASSMRLGDAGIRVIATRHEGGAAFMAEAHAQLTGRPAACIGTRAVGSANLAIGIHTARQDSAPMFALVGQVEGAHRGHEAFQEIDQVATIGGLAKWAAEPDAPDAVAPILGEAIRQALGGRPGPVLLSLPEDLLDLPAPADAHVDGGRPGPARPSDDGRPRRHRAPRIGPSARHPGRWRRPARPDLHGAAALRRAAPGPGHRRLAPCRRDLERPPALPRDGRPRGRGRRPRAARRGRRDARHRQPAERADVVGGHACPRRRRAGRTSTWSRPGSPGRPPRSSSPPMPGPS